jgi:hypothetical protein
MMHAKPLWMMEAAQQKVEVVVSQEVLAQM